MSLDLTNNLLGLLSIVVWPHLYICVTRLIQWKLSQIPWVLEVFLACVGHLRFVGRTLVRPKAEDTSGDKWQSGLPIFSLLEMVQFFFLFLLKEDA